MPTVTREHVTKFLRQAAPEIAKLVEKDATVGDVHAGGVIGDGKKKKPRSFDEALAEVDGKTATGKRFELHIDVAKVNAEQQMIFGWASVSSVDGVEVIDKQGDVIPIEELEAASYDFAMFAREQSDMHERRGVGRMIECMVFTPEKAALGITAKNEAGKQLFGMWVGFKVLDDRTWHEHKAGRRPEFSIGGHSNIEMRD